MAENEVNRFIFKLLIAAILPGLFFFKAFSAESRNPPDIKPAKNHEALNRKLAVPVSQKERKYLGLGQSGPVFTFNQVKADILIVEIFNMYCNFCQRAAPKVVRLYHLIQKRSYGDRIKIIGIGIQNTPLEVKVFKDKYKIPFPLFADPEGGAKANFFYTETPYFAVISLKDKDRLEVFYLNPGEFDSPEKFLGRILETYNSNG